MIYKDWKFSYKIRLKTLESKQSHFSTQDPIQDFHNLLRAEKAESRVKVLEQELLDNARQFAKQLMELEIQLTNAKRQSSRIENNSQSFSQSNSNGNSNVNPLINVN